MEASRYTILSKSRNQSLSQKEEAEQLASEEDIIAETSLLLDHINQKNCKNLEKHLKKIIKADKTKKTNFRFTRACFVTVFHFLLTNEKILTLEVFAELSSCFKLQKV